MPMSKIRLKNAAIAAKSAALPSIPKELLAGPMHRAPDQEQPGLRQWEGSQATGRGDQANLHRHQRQGGAGRT